MPHMSIKAKLKSLLATIKFHRIWNRFLAGNRWQIAGHGNQIQIGNSWLTNTLIEVSGANNTLIVGDHCRLHGFRIVIKGESVRVEIQDRCQLFGTIRAEDSGSRIVVGAGTTMERESYLGAFEGTSLQIGNDCMIAELVVVHTSDMHSIMDAETGVRKNPAADITLGFHVWLCRGATVLKGCQIGAHSIVGTCAIVSSTIPPHSLAIGAPAKVIRSQVDWSRERIAAAK